MWAKEILVPIEELALRLPVVAAAAVVAVAAAAAAVAAAAAAVPVAAVAARTRLYRQHYPDARLFCRYNLAWAALFAGRSTDTSLMADRHFAVTQTRPVSVADARTAAVQPSLSCTGRMWDRRRAPAVGRPSRSIP